MAEPQDPMCCPTCESQTRAGELSGRNAVDHGDGPEWCDDEWHDEDDDSWPADADYAWRDGRAVPVETVADISIWSLA